MKQLGEQGVSSTNGKVYGLGLGPGDPDLITVKALKILQTADVIAYPSAEGVPSLVRSIAAPNLPGHQIEIDMAMPMAVERFPAKQVYDKAAIEIKAHAEQGRTIAVLCEGDPFFFGSFMYLYQRLVSQLEIEIVPGVTSVAACASVAGLPLVARNESLTVLPGPLDDQALEARLEQADAFVIMKVGRHFLRLKALLSKLGYLERAWYIERATMEQQKVAMLGDVEQATAPYFSMILVHKRGRADA